MIPQGRKAAVRYGMAVGVVVMGAALAWASNGPWEGGLPADVDPFDRPVYFQRNNERLEQIGWDVAQQTGIPFAFDWPELERIGVLDPTVQPPGPKQIPLGWMLWWCLLECRSPHLTFVPQCDAQGKVVRIRFTSIEAAEKAEADLPYHRRYLGGLTRCLESPPFQHAFTALFALSRFGTTAEEALPQVEAFLQRPDVGGELRKRAEQTLLEIRAAVSKKQAEGLSGGRPQAIRMPKPPLAAAVAKAEAPAKPETLDPLLRKVRLPKKSHYRDELAEAMSRQIGIPFRVHKEDFVAVGWDRYPEAHFQVDDEPAVDVLWRFWLLSGWGDKFVFVVRKDALGNSTSVEFTTPAAAAARGDPLPFDSDGLARLKPHFDGPHHLRIRALRGLRHFDAVAEEALAAYRRHPGRKAIPSFISSGEESARILETALRRRTPHVPARPFPTEADPLSVQVQTPFSYLRADDWADALADASGVPIVLQPEDFPPADYGPATRIRVGAATATLRETLWRCTVQTGRRFTPRRDGSGKLTGFIMGTAAGCQRRGDREIADEESARILLRLASQQDYLQQRESLLALRRVGAALAAQTPRRPETDWVGGAASVHWRNFTAGAEEARFRTPFVVRQAEDLPRVARMLTEASGIQVQACWNDFHKAEIEYSDHFPFDAGPTPLRELLWTYVLRSDDRLAWVVRERDAAGGPARIEIVTWEGVDQRKEAVLLDRRDAPTILSTLEWALRSKQPSVVRRSLRLFHRMGAEAEGALGPLKALDAQLGAESPEAFEAAIVTVAKAAAAARGPYLPAKFPPPAAEWAGLRISLPQRRWPVDEVARAIADQTGIRVQVRYDDLARRFESLASGPSLMADEESLDDFLVRWGAAAKLECRFQHHDNGLPRAIEVATPEGSDLRSRIDAPDRPAEPSLGP